MSKAESELRQLCKQEFACEKDARLAAERINRKLSLHQLNDLEVSAR